MILKVYAHYLTALEIEGYEFDNAFDSDVLEGYSIDVAEDVGSISIRATQNDQEDAQLRVYRRNELTTTSDDDLVADVEPAPGESTSFDIVIIASSCLKLPLGRCSIVPVLARVANHSPLLKKRICPY